MLHGSLSSLTEGGLFGVFEFLFEFGGKLDGNIRDALDATMNYSAHTKFVSRWLDKLEAEDAAALAATTTSEAPSQAATVEVPATNPAQ